ncbi:MAG: phosphoribosylformylglycinamidine synthase [Alistipes sp.]|nr:phosphoribosylformylglycinamidine synthase [Alistipes sp.]
MVLFFRKNDTVFAVDAPRGLSDGDRAALKWLFAGAEPLDGEVVRGGFVGPRREMITPWSTNAVEIAQNMGVGGIVRIEEFRAEESDPGFDPMLNRRYDSLGQDIFTIVKQPDPVVYIDDIESYNRQEGLALSADEISYLEEVSRKMGRRLTDSEVFGFSQVNSEHCRHKIFNGQFVIDGKEKPDTLFGLIKKTTKENPNRVTSAYKDNCAFLEGPEAVQFSTAAHDGPHYYAPGQFKSVISVKAETHNFPTTVEPFNGAATGSGGEIRDRIAGGKGAFPLAGTAVYMTSYPRSEKGRPWEERFPERKWLYQTPQQILIKASNGASDFGNKFGQPLICGSLLTFEHEEHGVKYGYDKVIMQAGGIGYGKKCDNLKDEPQPGDKVVLLGGDNYRIGMGGGAVSSVATGEFANEIELNAVQRSNPEMQKRVYNAIRALGEQDHNPVVSIHDHGAGGHLNCLSELVEATGGRIELDKLPVGDPTLSAREIVGNESQERMGLVMPAAEIEHLKKIADRERAPMYVIGETTGDMRFTFEDTRSGEKPIDWKLEHMFGKAPRTVMNNNTVEANFEEVTYDKGKLVEYIGQVLQLEAVACKDWLTNKVDRSVTGRVAMQQTAGQIQLPVNDCAVVALDYHGKSGIATALGHAPVAALADPAAGSRLAIAESLTNIVLVPLAHGLKGVSLSANWMWPCRNDGEDARLYSAVEAASDFAVGLGINIPTGKDSLSMTQKYPDGEKVLSPGTVIITSAAQVSDITGCISPALKKGRSQVVYVDFSRGGFGLAGSSLAQICGNIGSSTPDIADAGYFARAFSAVQGLVAEGKILAGHDVSAGGLITALLEMTFTDNRSGIDADLGALAPGEDIFHVLFSERPAVVLQVADAGEVVSRLASCHVDAYTIGEVNDERRFSVKYAGVNFLLPVNEMRDVWYRSSYLLDRKQSGEKLALERFNNYKNTPLEYKFPAGFTGRLTQYGLEADRRKATGIKAAIIREKGCQCERETAWMMYLAGMDVKDVHMTDLIAGRETLEEVNLIAFVGGFSNSDVLGSAKGWAGAFLYNEKAKRALDNFYAREDTLSIGICNGCQLMVELGLITPADSERPRMDHNDSHKFESGFIGVDILSSPSVMLSSLEGSRLGIWVAHGEGKFLFPYPEGRYNIAMKYAYDLYPANPNGSQYNAAAIVSGDGRHLAMMPHLERAIRPWNWAYYPQERNRDEVSPWIEAFVNAARWIGEKKKR